jgi:hypothetical protein
MSYQMDGLNERLDEADGLTSAQVNLYIAGYLFIYFKQSVLRNKTATKTVLDSE